MVLVSVRQWYFVNIWWIIFSNVWPLTIIGCSRSSSLIDRKLKLDWFLLQKKKNYVLWHIYWLRKPKKLFSCGWWSHFTGKMAKWNRICCRGRTLSLNFITVQPLVIISSSFFAKNDNMKRKKFEGFDWGIFREPYLFDVLQVTYHKRVRKDDDYLAADRCRFLNGKHENFHKNFSTTTFKG